ncbi:MAG: hypothetical protein ACLR2O_11335 [Coprococcus sp.]
MSRCGNVILLLRGKNYQELTGNPKYQSWIDSEVQRHFREEKIRWSSGNGVSAGFEQMMEKMIKGKRKKIAFVVHGDDHVGDGSI